VKPSGSFSFMFWPYCIAAEGVLNFNLKIKGEREKRTARGEGE
jgi:hypothetical protein